MRTVLLRHRLPDGSAHLDWMIETDPDAALVTFRVARRSAADLGWTDRSAVGTAPRTPFHAERIGDHRRDYLDYQGPVSGGRGEVARVASGSVTIHEDGPDLLDLTLDWGTGPKRLAGRPSDPPTWRFEPRP